MSRKRERVVEYKDTFEFRLFPKYNYTPHQQRRFLLFQSPVKSFKKAINYAEHFNEPNRINLVYMIGYSARAEDYVRKTAAGNTIVLFADIPAEDIDLYDQYWSIVALYASSGLVSKDGVWHPTWFDTRKREEKIGDSVQDKTFLEVRQEHRELDMLIAQYDLLKLRMEDYFSDYILVCPDLPESKRMTHTAALDWAVKHYFPYGCECMGLSQNIGRLKAVNDGIKAGLNGENAGKLLGIPSDDCARVCAGNIKKFRSLLNAACKADKCCNLCTAYAEMTKPPYGWGEDAFAGYCFGTAMKDFLGKSWVFDSCGTFTLTECAETVIRTVMRGKRNKRDRDYTLIVDANQKLIRRLASAFGVRVSDQDAPLQRFLAGTLKHLEGVTRIPVAITDGKLYEVIDAMYRLDNHFKVSYGFPKAVTDGFLEYFTEERCREIRQKIKHIDEELDKFLTKNGITIGREEVLKYCTTSASCWCWSADFFLRAIKDHQKKIWADR